MKGAALILAGLLSLSAASAETHQVRVFIDGKEIQGAVLQTNGTIVLPPGTLETAPAPPPAPTLPSPPVVTSAPVKVVASVPPPPPPAPPAPSIKGKLTWYKSVWNSQSPDEGAQIWLMKEEEASQLATVAGGTQAEPIPPKAIGWETRLTKEYNFPRAVADRQGDFFFDNVPEGRYVLVIKSVRCKWTTPRDRNGKLRFKPVEVRKGLPISFSLDLGVTPDALK